MDIRYNKGLGQNFIYDTNLLRAIVADAEVTQDDTVLEIGAGAGTLTCQLAKTAKRVVSFEIDRALKPILEQKTAEFDNVELHIKDFMTVNAQQLGQIMGTKFKVVANLPYYITTSILFFLIEGGLEIDSITILVQKEVAQRLVASPNSSDYGALTLTVGAQYQAKIKRIVTKELFTPRPKVDSAVVHLCFKAAHDPSLTKTIRTLFSMRRKTVINNLMGGFGISRVKCEEILSFAGIDLMARAEQLDLQQIKQINAGLFKKA